MFREGEAIEVKAWLWSLVCAKSEAFLTTDAKLKWWTPEGLRELIPFFNTTALRSEQKPMRHDEPCWLRPSLGWRTAPSPGPVTHTHCVVCRATVPLSLPELAGAGELVRWRHQPHRCGRLVRFSTRTAFCCVPA